MTYSPSDFGPGKSGPQIAWLRWRLSVHGIAAPDPGDKWWDEDHDRTQRFQSEQGWAGPGADGIPGPETLKRLAADPVVAPPSHGKVPSDVLDLSKFKITYPDGTEQKNLTGVSNEWFHVNAEGDGVVFHAPVGGGSTTPHTEYQRCELRETSPKAWDSARGTNLMTVTQAITHLPGGKPDLVSGQIHDGKDDVIEILLSGKNLYVSESKGKGKGSVKHLLDDNYVLGSKFRVELLANADGLFVNYLPIVPGGSGHLHERVELTGKHGTDWYYKAGCYDQANASNGSGFGEVVIYGLTVTHRA